MSDHTNSNIHRGDATSGRGLLIAFALIVAVVAILALVGSFAGGGDGAAGDNAITPAGEGIVPPTPEQPAPVPAE